MLFVSIGLGAVTIIGASALIGQTAFALSAAIGGFLLLNWPKQRFTFGATAQLVIITVLTALLAQALFLPRPAASPCCCYCRYCLLTVSSKNHLYQIL
ncbi:hypothetical protein [Aliamphritea spongicola]|nr:hypothetical protein [Aliamphritea spongicola]